MSAFNKFFSKNKKQKDLFFCKYYIFGLGNPGAKYHNTRHNAGFDVLSILAERHNLKFTRGFRNINYAFGKINGEMVMLIKPQTFMNNSGIAVLEVMEAYKLKTDKIIVVYDDIDIPLSKIRIRLKGSAGTHNGMKSIIYHLREDNFLRIRVGIGKNEGDIISHVLEKYSDREFETAYSGYCKAADSIEEIIASGVQSAMRKYN